jgi:hypothetical protein
MDGLLPDATTESTPLARQLHICEASHCRTAASHVVTIAGPPPFSAVASLYCRDHTQTLMETE